jgi:hypothetical protein
MPQSTETTRLQQDLREEYWTAPGSTIGGWPTSIAPAWRATLPPRLTMPECTCPIDCACDHEHD